MKFEVELPEDDIQKLRNMCTILASHRKNKLETKYLSPLQKEHTTGEVGALKKFVAQLPKKIWYGGSEGKLF